MVERALGDAAEFGRRRFCHEGSAQIIVQNYKILKWSLWSNLDTYDSLVIVAEFAVIVSM